MSNRPTALPVIPDNFPADITPLNQFVAWDFEVRDGKPTKVPINPRTGKKAQANNPKTWGTLAAALVCMQERILPGIGIVFSPDDPHTGIDLDTCRDPETGAIANWAMSIIHQLDSYTEVSPSGTGVKIIVRASKPGPRCKTTKPNTIEMYESERFFTLTGHRLDGTPATIEDRQDELTIVYDAIFPAEPTIPRAPASLSTFSADDRDVIADIQRDTKARPLWEGDTTAHNDDHSAADLALCNKLRFYTGRDPIQMDRLFRQSGLMRDKWDRPARNGETYGEGTIQRALPGDVRTRSAACPAPATNTQAPAHASTHHAATEGATCAAELAIIAELKAELAREREARIAAELLQSQTMAVLANPGIPDGLKVTTLAVIFQAASKESRHVAGDPSITITNDGYVPIYRAAIAESSGCSVSAVSSRLNKIADTGIVQTRVRRVRNEETGDWQSQLQVKVSAPMREVMTALAKAEVKPIDPETGRPKTWGGKRDKRPATCPDCPDADVIVKRIAACADCGQILSSLPDERISAELDVKSQDATSEDPPYDASVVLPRDSKMRHQSRQGYQQPRARDRFFDARAEHYAVPERAPIQVETDPVSPLCGLCRRPLRNAEERAAGSHDYDCLASGVPIRTVKLPAPAWGDD